VSGSDLDQPSPAGTDGPSFSFVDNAAASRFEVLADGAVVGVCDYEISGAEVVLPHTMIFPSMRGNGLASRLVRFALDDLALRNVRVVPACWFVAEFIAANPEYRRLLAPA
jgi:predicted GNAT family acetyltransferase